jgi:hypothetical protein
MNHLTWGGYPLDRVNPTYFGMRGGRPQGVTPLPPLPPAGFACNRFNESLAVLCSRHTQVVTGVDLKSTAISRAGSNPAVDVFVVFV